MMKAVGYVFTDNLIKALSKRGFDFIEDESPAPNGFVRFYIPLKNGTLEIREILDEEKYLKFSGKKTLIPFSEENSKERVNFTECSNTVFEVREFLYQHDLHNKDLVQYFKIRKESDFAAVLLVCASFDKFLLKCKVDKIFDYQGKKTALIHLNPACFDILVQE